MDTCPAGFKARYFGGSSFRFIQVLKVRVPDVGYESSAPQKEAPNCGGVSGAIASHPTCFQVGSLSFAQWKEGLC